MALEVRTTGDEDYPKHLKVLIGGVSGAGKTRVSATFPNVLFASAESGLLSVLQNKVRYVNVESSATLKELRNQLDQPPAVCEQMLGGPVDTVVLDTVDELQRIFFKERLLAKRKEYFDQQDWGWIGEEMRTVLRSFRNLEMNVVFTTHLKETVDQATGQVFYKPSLQGAIGDEISNYMDLSLFLRTEMATRIVGNESQRYERRYLQTYKDPQRDWIKDRSGQLPPDLEVNFKDDYQRMYDAIFGGIVTSDWDREAEKTVEVLQAVEIQTSPDVVEKLAEKAEARTEPAEVVQPELEVEVSTPEPEPEDTVPDPEPKPKVDDEGPWTCEGCGKEIDNYNEKSLSEIMLRKILCRVCYREIELDKKKK